MSETNKYDMRSEAARNEIADPETTVQAEIDARAMIILISQMRREAKIRTDYWRDWSKADGTPNTKNG